MKNGGEHLHSAHAPGQSSPRPVINQRVVNSKQSAPGFIGPQLPPHMMKVILSSEDWGGGKMSPPKHHTFHDCKLDVVGLLETGHFLKKTQLQYLKY